MKRNLPTYSVQSEVFKKLKTVDIPQQNIIQNYQIVNDAPTYYLVITQPEILNNDNNTTTRNRRRILKQSDEKYVDDAMAKWFEQVRDRDESISGKIIQDKALFFNEKLNGPKAFKASSGWIHKFKQRCGIQYIQKKEGNNSESIQYFSQVLREKIELENLSLENIYNADETGIHWKIPDFCTTSIETSEMKVSNRNEEICNRVTALFCSNATGNHQIPLLVIGEEESPNCLTDLITNKLKHNRLKFLTSLNVIYTGQSSAWMDKEIFKLWYRHVFIPSVLNHQKMIGTTGKVLLILDNAPCHSDLDELNSVNSQFEIINLAHNVPSMIQPMEQDLMSTAIKIYKKNLLTLMFKSKLRNVDEFWSNYNLKDCITFLSSAWKNLNNSPLLRQAWTLILDNYCDTSVYYTVCSNNENLSVLSNNSRLIEELSQFPDEICDKLIARHSPGADCSIRKLQKDKVIIVKWFKTRDDFGWEPITDNEIVDLILNNKKKDEMVNEFSIVDCENENLENENITTTSEKCENEIMTFDEIKKNELVNIMHEYEESDNYNDKSNQITSSEALNALMNVKKWIMSCDQTSENHHHYIAELENLISQYC
ncbi:jerky protein homolog-like [Leptopilina boulardi]|uniref:jerky protein homolog-like n=1 Tax=Leptopilina boulardi TaxID=63433 RepID=UPI0021F5CE56|nr:jerky protein homolog-like [Leptopilina boulardi]